MRSMPLQAQRRSNKGGLLPLVMVAVCIATGLLVVMDTFSSSDAQANSMQAMVDPSESSQTIGQNRSTNAVFLKPAEDGPERQLTVFRLISLVLGCSAIAAVIAPVSSKRRLKSQTLQYVSLGLAITMLVLAFSPSSSANVMPIDPVHPVEPITVSSAFASALQKAFKSGTGGFLAGVCQVIAFMWLRTTMNYQYKNGGTFLTTLGILWAEGGIGRLYQGLFPWAILQAPLSRFGDTAANDLVLGLQAAVFPSIPLPLATGVGSFCGAAWRVIITPIDTCKTTLQTDGAKGWALLKEKISKGGIWVLWYGWEGNYLANVVGNFPFFFTLNQLTAIIPAVTGMWMGLVRHAFIGAIAATISDVVSNSIRVMKTKKQTSTDPNMGYIRAAKEVIELEGLFGFMFRGLETRIFTNVMQGAFFTVLWRGLSK